MQHTRAGSGAHCGIRNTQEHVLRPTGEAAALVRQSDLVVLMELSPLPVVESQLRQVKNLSLMHVQHSSLLSDTHRVS